METTCPHCRGTGFEIRRGPDGISRAVRCACGYADVERRLLAAARIPRRYDHCGLDNFEEHNATLGNARATAADWVARWPDRDHGLLFHGSPGIGKTHLAVGVLRALAAKGARVLFYEQRELLKALQGTFQAGAERSESDVLGPVLSAEVVALDDLGAGRTSDWARDVLHEIIAHRYNARLPMILTTNCEIGDADDKTAGDRRVLGRLTLRQRLGDALMSRLYEMCRFVELGGADYRQHLLNARIARD